MGKIRHVIEATGLICKRIRPVKITTQPARRTLKKPASGRVHGDKVVTAEMHFNGRLTWQQNLQELNDMNRSINSIRTLVDRRDQELSAKKTIKEKEKALEKLKGDKNSYTPKISKLSLERLNELHGMLNTRIRLGETVKRLEAIRDNPGKVKFAWLFPSGNYKSHIGNGRKFLKRLFDKAVRIKGKAEPRKFYNEKGKYLFDLKTNADINNAINFYRAKIAKAKKSFDPNRYNYLKAKFVNGDIVPQSNHIDSVLNRQYK